MTNVDKTEGFIARTTLVSRSANGELFHLAVDAEQQQTCLVVFTAAQLQTLMDQAHQALAVPPSD